MNKSPLILGLMTAGCVISALPHRATAAPSDEDFKKLLDKVEQLDSKVEKLEQSHEQDQKAHEEDQKVHQQDQQKIHELQLQLGETQKTASDAEKTAHEAAQVQPIYRIPTDAGSVNHNFLILGDAEIQYAKVPGQHGTFLLSDFAPIFLYRAGDDLLFEAGFDFILQNNSPGGSGYTTTVNLSFATLDYILNDYVTLEAGNMLLPLGTYSERSAGWLNKFPDQPLAEGLVPGNGVGAQLRGAVSLGTSGQSLTYSIYGVNGPGSADGTGNAAQIDLAGGNVGFRSGAENNAIGNLHGSPSGGARVGWFFPYRPHYDLELGISGQSGEWDNAGSHLWSAGVFDASLHLGPFFEAKGAYIRTKYGSDDLGTINPEGWWAQAGYKLAGLNLDLPLVNNLEMTARYDSFQDGMGAQMTRDTVGYVYYLSNVLLFEGDYEFLHGNDLGQKGDTILFQLSYGF